MRVLFVHEYFGALAGAEANLFHTASELKRRGHEVGLLHGTGTGRGEADWGTVFANRFALAEDSPRSSVIAAFEKFHPDAIYVHKLADLQAIKALLALDAPLVRMVHDHDLYCMRSYKYHYFSREICTRPASPYCVFPCGAFLGRNHHGRAPVKWVSYSAKKKEIQLNRQFDRLIVGGGYMRDELLRNGFRPDKIVIQRSHAPPTPRRGGGRAARGAGAGAGAVRVFHFWRRQSPELL